MGAELDLDYLRGIAVGSADQRVLDSISAARRELLAGRELSDMRESGGRDNRGHLANRKDYLELNLEPKPGTSISLILDPSLAPATLDTFIEIFRDGAHTRAQGFAPSAEVAGTIVDLGANEGLYTLLFKLRRPASRIIAVEPLEENVAVLKHNLAANRIEGVEVVRAAVRGRQFEGTETTTLETYPHVGTVASTDIRAFPRPWIDPHRISRRRVPVLTLRRLLDERRVRSASLLKMDVEGSEAEILTDTEAAELLRRFERVVVECHGSAARAQCRRALTEAGFRCVHAEQKRSGDLYFLRAPTGTQQFRSGYRRLPQPRFPADGAGEGPRP